MLEALFGNLDRTKTFIPGTFLLEIFLGGTITHLALFAHFGLTLRREAGSTYSYGSTRTTLFPKKHLYREGAAEVAHFVRDRLQGGAQNRLFLQGPSPHRRSKG